MNHQRQTGFDAPTYLFLKGEKLLLFELTAPVEVEAYFADGKEFRGER